MSGENLAGKRESIKARIPREEEDQRERLTMFYVRVCGSGRERSGSVRVGAETQNRGFLLT
jgi:hypothetical protein